MEVKEMDSEEKHFIVIHVGSGSGFTSILGNSFHGFQQEMQKISATAIKKLIRPHSDPYIKISIDDNPNMTFKTHVIFDCENGNPRWDQFSRHYVNTNELPHIINVSAFDKSDDPEMPDALYGSFKIDCDAEKLFDTKGKVWSNMVQLGTDNCKFRFELCYDCCSATTLKQRVEEKAFSNQDLDGDTAQWIEKNTPLYFEICQQNIRGMQISTDMFGNIAYPPMKYKIGYHFKNFVNEYALYDQKKKSIFYDEELDILYVLPNANNDNYNMHLGGFNVTGEVHLLWRYVYIKDEILAEQDAEFNIYKSYLFDPTPEKLVYTFLAISIQICLTMAICYDIVQGAAFGFEDGAEGVELTIKMLSGGVFVLLSIATNRTTQLYYTFYQRIGLMFSIPWYLLWCDFLSNIFVSITITLVSYLFLIQSESYTDLVLNAFALQFVAEIDDMVNTFDSDEEVVLQADLRAFYNTDCAVPRKISYTWREFVGVLWSPFGIFLSIWTGFKAVKSVFISKSHKFVLDRKSRRGP